MCDRVFPGKTARNVTKESRAALHYHVGKALVRHLTTGLLICHPTYTSARNMVPFLPPMLGIPVPSPPADNIRAMTIVRRIRQEIIRTVLSYTMIHAHEQFLKLTVGLHLL